MLVSSLSPAKAYSTLTNFAAKSSQKGPYAAAKMDIPGTIKSECDELLAPARKCIKKGKWDITGMEATNTVRSFNRLGFKNWTKDVENAVKEFQKCFEAGGLGSKMAGKEKVILDCKKVLASEGKIPLTTPMSNITLEDAKKLASKKPKTQEGQVRA